MSAMQEIRKRFQAILEALDSLAEQSSDDALEDMNAELEDALFMLSEIDTGSEDWREELRDMLETLDALRVDYARRPDTSAIAGQMEGLICMAEGLVNTDEGGE